VLKISHIQRLQRIERTTGDIMRQENEKELISMLMNSSYYLTLSVRERYGLVLRLIQDYPLLSGRGDTNLKGSSDQNNRPPIVN